MVYKKRYVRRKRTTRKYKRSFRRPRKYGGRTRRYGKRSYSTTFQRGLYAKDRQVVKLRYVQYLDVSATVITPDLDDLTFIYRGSSPFDPYLGTAGGECTGYTDFTTRYGKQVVMGSSIKVMIQDDPVTGTAVPYGLTVIPTRNNTVLYDNEEAKNVLEMPYAKQKVVELSNSNSRSRQYISSYMTAARMYGVSKKAVHNNEDYQNTTASSTDPKLSWYWHVLIFFPWSGVATISCKAQMKIEITYYVQFLRRTTVPTE